MPGTWSKWVCAVVAAISACACSSSDGSPTGGSQQQSSLPKNCKGATEYSAGIEAKGDKGLISVTLEDSNPAPPIVGDNDWTIDVKDADGKPLEGADLQFFLYMPAHQHGGAKDPIITDQGGGTYDAKEVNFNMQGLWQITVKATSSDGSVTDQAMFTLCAQ